MKYEVALAVLATAIYLCTLPAFSVPAPGVDDPLLNRKAVVGERVPIAILHMHDSVPFFRRLGAVTGGNKKRYAEQHGYDYIESTPKKTIGILKPAPCQGRNPDAAGLCWEQDENFDIDHSRAPTFGKIKLSLAACQGRDNGWLLWMDADAMIVNQTVPLESLIDDGYDMMLAYDWLMLNAGIILFKCSNWTKQLLHNVYDAREFDKARALDQSSFQQHLDNLSKAERDAHVKVVPKYAMNVYTEEYRPGDFLLHMAGKLYEATEPGIVAIANQFDILSMVDDIDDVRAFFRSRRFLNYYSGTCKIDAGHRQAECKPDDPRRILLNETLLSMSYPNRYRHVGLRYYWLGNWKDKYDVPGWDVKKRALPLPQRAPPGKEMPPIPVAAHHDGPASLTTQNDEQAKKLEDSKRTKAEGDAHSEKHDPRVDVPEVDHDLDLKPHEQDGGVLKNIVDDDEVEVEDSGSWPLWFWLLVIALCLGAVVGVLLVLKRRRRKASKMQ